jgi:hypothetical protein
MNQLVSWPMENALDILTLVLKDRQLSNEAFAWHGVDLR